MNTIKRKNTKHCKWCNSIFKYKQPTAKYCSNACKCQAYQNRIKAGQTHKPVSGFSENLETYYTNEIDDLKEYVKALESQIMVILEEHNKTLSAVRELNQKHMNELSQYYMKHLEEAYQVKSNSYNQAQNEEKNEQIIAALSNIAQNLFNK